MLHKHIGYNTHMIYIGAVVYIYINVYNIYK